MSLFSRQQDLGQALMEPVYTQSSWEVAFNTPSSAGTTTSVYLGRTLLQGWILREVSALCPSAITASAVNYLTFSLFVSRLQGGTVFKKAVGTPVTTKGTTLKADVPFRLHAESLLNERLPVGAGLLLVVANTGGLAPVNASYLVTPTATLVFGG